jgi:uncharacterized protein DUF3617
MRNLLLLLTLGAIPACAAAQYQPLNVKTGQWQTTVLVNSGGSLALPSGQVAKLTPEQRARVESAMKQASKPKTTTHTNQDCLTQDELNKGTPFKSDEKKCTEKVLNSSSSKLNVEQDCVEDSMATRTIMSLDAMSPELVKGTGTVTATSEGHTFTSNITLTSQWLSASCSIKNKEGALPAGLKSKLSALGASRNHSSDPK